MLIGISRFGPAETQLDFYLLTKTVFIQYIYIYIYVHLQVVHAVRVSVNVSVCVRVVNYKPQCVSVRVYD